jgi:hypothetical protein
VRDDETPEPTDNRWSSPTATDGVLRLTYDQIGRRLDMTADAARQLARRKGWERTRPNAIGEPVVVAVPASELPRKQPSVHRRTTDGEPSDNRRAVDSGSSVTGGVEPLSVHRRLDLQVQALAVLEDALTAANTRAEEAMALAGRVTTELANASARADVEITTLRDTVGGLRDAVARAQTRAKEAEEARQAGEARNASLEAEASAKGAQLQAEAARARGVAQEAVQAAESLNTAMDQLKAGQVRMLDAHAREIEQARAAAQAVEARIASLEADLRVKDTEITEQRRSANWASSEAQQAREAVTAAEEQAETLRQAEEARKGRGRLRRAWDGWRGR